LLGETPAARPRRRLGHGLPQRVETVRQVADVVSGG
jgi:hypothetical protein